MSDKAKVLNLTRNLAEKYRYDPIGWIKENITFDGLKLDWLTSQQEKIITNLVEHKNICVSSGTGTGKTATMALLIQWFLCTHLMCKIPTTAPSGKLLNDILWAEVGVWLNRNKLKSIYKLNKGKLAIKYFPEWFAVARTVPKDQRQLNDTLAGFHGQEGILNIIDEASGVPDPVYTALVGAMTDENSYIALISNPVSTGGFYYDTITDPEGKGKDFKTMFFSSKDSPLVDPSYEEFVINRWGKDSAMYKAKILGLPIAEYDSVVVPPEVFDEIVNSQKAMMSGAYTLGVDVGGGGPDPTVFCFKCGNSIYKWEQYPKTDPTWVSDQIIRTWRSQFQGKIFVCIVDAHGIGAGVYSNLLKANLFSVIGFIGPQKSAHPTMFENQRVEGYYNLHKCFNELQFPAPPPERLKKELANLKFNYGEGVIKMEPKKTLKSRLGFSPDFADCLMMTMIADVFGAPCAGSLITGEATNILKKLVVKKRTSKYGKFQKFVD